MAPQSHAVIADRPQPGWQIPVAEPETLPQAEALRQTALLAAEHVVRYAPHTAHAVQEVEPTAAEKLPVPQAVHAADDGAATRFEYEPNEQAVQLAAATEL